jgi:hypothetical protein
MTGCKMPTHVERGDVLITRVWREVILGAIGAGLIFGCACTKKAGENAAQAPEPLDKVERAEPPAPIQVVHKTFQVTTSAQFEFDVPQHVISPKMHGTFKAYSTSNPAEAASVDLLVLTPAQLEDLSNGAGEPTYSVVGSTGQTVDYALQPTMDDAQKYYLVFRNPDKRRPRNVDAEFTVSFE